MLLKWNMEIKKNPITYIPQVESLHFIKKTNKTPIYPVLNPSFKILRQSFLRGCLPRLQSLVQNMVLHFLSCVCVCYCVFPVDSLATNKEVRNRLSVF